jgi:hypothetical protein
VVVLTDADKAGEHAAFALSVLGSRAVRAKLPPKRDAADCHPSLVREVIESALRGT